MDNLIAELERATEGSRGLDAQIENCLEGGSDNDLAYILTDIERITKPSHYTTSLDAALTLVMKGHAWGLTSRCGTSPPVSSCGPKGGPIKIGKAPTPVLALCIAALKARQAKEEDG